MGTPAPIAPVSLSGPRWWPLLLLSVRVRDRHPARPRAFYGIWRHGRDAYALQNARAPALCTYMADSDRIPDNPLLYLLNTLSASLFRLKPAYPNGGTRVGVKVPLGVPRASEGMRLAIFAQLLLLG